MIRKSIINNAICHYVGLFNNTDTSDKFFKHLIPFINFKSISDRDILQNDRIINYVNFNKFDKLRIVRLIIRKPEIIDKIDQNVIKFKIRDLIPIFLSHPNLMEYFEINLEEVSGHEAIKLLECDQSLINKLKIEKYNYGIKDIMDIIDKFSYNDEIMEKVDFEKLDHYATRMMLMKTGNKYISKINFDKLKATDWVDILNKRPELIKFCNLKLFESGDCYLLTKIVDQFPYLENMIIENINRISALGWENLLINNPIKYKDICKYELLSKKNWENILRQHFDLFEEIYLEYK